MGFFTKRGRFRIVFERHGLAVRIVSLFWDRFKRLCFRSLAWAYLVALHRTAWLRIFAFKCIYVSCRIGFRWIFNEKVYLFLNLAAGPWLQIFSLFFRSRRIIRQLLLCPLNAVEFGSAKLQLILFAIPFFNDPAICSIIGLWFASFD